jgi:hypothetical protein
MENLDLTISREQQITFKGVNSYILKDFAERIKLISKELETLATETNLSRRKEITEHINNLYRGNTI